MLQVEPDDEAPAAHEEEREGVARPRQSRVAQREDDGGHGDEAQGLAAGAPRKGASRKHHGDKPCPLLHLRTPEAQGGKPSTEACEQTGRGGALRDSRARQGRSALRRLLTLLPRKQPQERRADERREQVAHRAAVRDDGEQRVKHIGGAEGHGQLAELACEAVGLPGREPQHQQRRRPQACQGRPCQQQRGGEDALGSQQHKPGGLQGDAACDAAHLRPAAAKAQAAQRGEACKRPSHAGEVEQGRLNDGRGIGRVGQQHQDHEEQGGGGQAPAQCRLHDLTCAELHAMVAFLRVHRGLQAVCVRRAARAMPWRAAALPCIVGNAPARARLQNARSCDLAPQVPRGRFSCQMTSSCDTHDCQDLRGLRLDGGWADDARARQALRGG